MQTGTGQTAHSKPLIFDWATGTTLAAAIASTLSARTTTWTAFFGGDLVSPNLRMPLIRVVTAATNGTIGDGTGTFPLVTNQPYGPFTIEKADTLTFTGDAVAKVFIEC